MARLLLLFMLVLIFQNSFVFSETDPQRTTIPNFNGSYIAVGEAVQQISPDVWIQVKFDETFDADTGNAALTVYEAGQNLTFVEDALTGQTFKYFNSGCVEMTTEEWIDVSAPPSLMIYEKNDGKVVFSLKQLFNIPDTYLVVKAANIKTFYRSIPAKSWSYEIQSKKAVDGSSTTVNIHAYWSDPSWSTTSSDEQQTPLGFRILTNVSNEAGEMISSERHINIFLFIDGAVDQKQFEPRQGIQCVGRNSTYSFPTLSKAKAISFKSEIIFPYNSEVKTMDVWHDMKNGYHRVDLDRLDEKNVLANSRYYTSAITSRTLDTTYLIQVANGQLTCEVMPLSEYKWDYQEIINPKLELKLWSIDYILGLNTTNYTYIGKTTKRNIPCHLFQGIRKDWPVKEANIQSLWEWCVIATLGSEFKDVNFLDGNIGLVSALITINQTGLTHDLKLTDKDTATIIHHFYDVAERDPADMDFSTFDVSRCFTLEQQQRLEFAIDLIINKFNLDEVENATSDTRFLGEWKTAISEKAQLPLNTLRITRLQSMVWNGKLLISFTILDVHPSLANDENQNKPSLEQAINNLNDSINHGELHIKYVWAKGEIPEKVMAWRNTLKYIIIKQDNDSIISPPTPFESTTNGIIFSLKTPSSESTSGEPTGEGTTGSGPVVEGTTGSGPTGEGTTGSGPTGEGTTGSGPTGEGTTGSGPTGEGTTGSGQVVEGTTSSGSIGEGTTGGGSTGEGTTEGKSTNKQGDTTENPGGTESPLTRKVFTGHASGTVAGVSIAMLLVGLTLGAGGTFYKFRGRAHLR